MITTASAHDIDDFIQQYPDWHVVDGKLHREYIFKDFIQAFAFMTETALLAEAGNHHPEWFNVYKKVVVDLTTHEAGGITQRDFELASSMETIARQRLDN